MKYTYEIKPVRYVHTTEVKVCAMAEAEAFALYQRVVDDKGVTRTFWMRDYDTLALADAAKCRLEARWPAGGAP